jgi:hypothetical protein
MAALTDLVGSKDCMFGGPTLWNRLRCGQTVCWVHRQWIYVKDASLEREFVHHGVTTCVLYRPYVDGSLETIAVDILNKIEKLDISMNDYVLSIDEHIGNKILDADKLFSLLSVWLVEERNIQLRRYFDTRGAPATFSETFLRTLAAPQLAEDIEQTSEVE